MREKFLDLLGKWAGERTYWMLGIIIVITIVTGSLASQLKINMDMSMLLPKDSPMTKEIDRIFEEFNGANSVFIVVQGEQEKMIEYAQEIAPKIPHLESWIKNYASEKIKSQHKALLKKHRAGETKYAGQYYDLVDYKMPVDFLKNHALMLQKVSDLKNFEGIYKDPNFIELIRNINNSMEKEYIQSEEKISTTERERSAVQYLDGIETWVDNVNQGLTGKQYNAEQAYNAADAIAIGNPYLTSPDRAMLLITVEPTFSMMNMNCVMPGVNALEELVKTEAKSYDIKAGLAGAPVLSRDEMVAATEDSFALTMLALVAVFILFIITFRMFSSPFLAIINLMIGIVWSLGISYLLVHVLNMLTAMCSVILVGLGIDFSIHIISLFSEKINLGVKPEKAIRETMQKAGTGIITGGITTAAAFLTLSIGRSAGMREFGLISGSGLLIILISTLITLPTLLILKERIFKKFKKKSTKPYDVTYNSIGTLAQFSFDKWKFSLIAMIIVTIGMGFMITKVQFDYNYLNMEPKGLESIELNNKIIDKFNMSSDATKMTASSLEECYQYTEEARDKSSISYIESISDYLPPREKQKRRQAKINEIHQTMQNSKIRIDYGKNDYNEMINQLYRLEANIIEMQDMAFIGGQDMVDEKATRLVGDPNIARSRISLEDLIYAPEAENANARLRETIKMLKKANQDIQEDTLSSSLHTLQDSIALLSQNYNRFATDLKKQKLNKFYQSLLEIVDNKMLKGRLSAFIDKINNNPVDLARLENFSNDFSTKYKGLVLNLADTSKIQLSMLPEKITSKYVSNDGSLYLLTLYPKGNIWDLRNLETFYQQTNEISHRMAGTPPMFYYLIDIIGKDGRRAAILTVILVFIFLLIDFKSPLKSLIAMIPLVTGFLWMLGLMALFGVKLTLVNIMGLPLILGIGIDDGVHILHRYQIEGKTALHKVYSSTGKAVIITSFTTMISFGSLVFATYRGYGSLGIALFIGVGACLLTTILILPSILGLKNRNLNEKN
ncbi:MAG: MMPL family transporter [Candidatus Marinimicrobia bacterium]|nr:MMPL family transporter [Candidatus Neomarinimicrobiota bacterium]